MAKTSEHGAFRARCLCLPALAGLSLAAAPAGAQDAMHENTRQGGNGALPGPGWVAVSPSPPCRIDQQQGTRKNAHVVLANCQGQAIFLGEANRFDVFHNPELRSMIVYLHLDNERRVLTLSLEDDGQVLLREDVGGQIALAAGQGPTSGLDLDLTGFCALAASKLVP